MSFILDALRKSEHDRQRQTGPALVEVAAAPAKPRTNAWATAAIVLLVVNLLAIGALLLYKSREEPAPAASAPAAGPSDAAPASAATAQVSVTRTRPVPANPAAPPPMLRPARPDPALGTGRNPLADELPATASPALDEEVVRRAAAAPAGPPAVVAAPVRPGKVIYETLPEADFPAAPDRAASAAAPAGLPTADEFTARGSLPELKLELHVYSTRPQDRFVFINSTKYREGDTTAEGAVVQQITRDGVVLELRGNRFLLPRD